MFVSLKTASTGQAAALAVGLLGCAATASAIPTYFVDTADFQNVFAENFSDAGWTNRWSQFRAEGSKGGSGTGIYRGDAVSRIANGDGMLSVEAYSDSSGNDYVGSVRSDQSWTYGYFEARIKFQETSGMHSAFWMMPQGSNHGTAGGTRPDLYGAEIDIVEHRAFDENNVDISNHYYTADHWGGYGANHQSKGKLNRNVTTNHEFHTYGVQWNEDMYKFFIDDVYVGHTINDGISGTNEYMILSTNVGVGWAGDVGNYGSRGSDGSRMMVDWVKVWQPSTTVPEPGTVAGVVVISPLLLRRRRRSAAAIRG